MAAQLSIQSFHSYLSCFKFTLVYMVYRSEWDLAPSGFLSWTLPSFHFWGERCPKLSDFSSQKEIRVSTSPVWCHLLKLTFRLEKYKTKSWGRWVESHSYHFLSSGVKSMLSLAMQCHEVADFSILFRVYSCFPQKRQYDRSLLSFSL